MHYVDTFFFVRLKFSEIVHLSVSSAKQIKNTQSSRTVRCFRNCVAHGWAQASPIPLLLTFPFLIYLLLHGVALPPEILQLWPTSALLDCYAVRCRLIFLAPTALLRRQFSPAPTTSARRLARGRSRRGITIGAPPPLPPIATRLLLPLTRL
jgi:hypothetical protein